MSIPLEKPILATMLNAAVRPVDEPQETQSAYKQQAVQTYQQLQAEKQRDFEEQLQREREMHPGFGTPHFQTSTVGSGVPGTLQPLNMFAGRGKGRIK